jgi:glycine dehydrogenase subunit 2
MGIARPGDFGVDIMHFNLHKTFSTPHGGGGPGSGPVGVTEKLDPFLPVPVPEKRDQSYALNEDRPDTIGRVRSFYGNVPVMVKAYTYLRTLGSKGVRRVSENAVLNANYLKSRLEKTFDVPFGQDRPCMHEFVVSAEKFKNEYGISALDIGKGLIDRSFHPPTVYFPLIVPEAMMIEPTETESLETLDAFAECMEDAVSNPDTLHSAPVNTAVSRPDEVKAARNPVLKQNTPAPDRENKGDGDQC